MPLLARIIVAILLGVVLGNFFNEATVRLFLTFNGIFSQFLGFMIPLIIIGLVTPAIADIGHGAGKLLLATVGIAFADTINSASEAGASFDGVTGLKNVFREDEVVPSLPQDKILANVDGGENGYFPVRKRM